jgi:hypothetical protein
VLIMSRHFNAIRRQQIARIEVFVEKPWRRRPRWPLSARRRLRKFG